MNTHNVFVFLGLDLAKALDLIQNWRLDGPAVVHCIVDGHAILTEGSRGAVLQALVKGRVVCRRVPVHPNISQHRHLQPVERCVSK